MNAIYESKYNGKVVNPEIGEVVINRKGIKASLGHGIGKEKASAFMAVPDIIKKGKLINVSENWKGRKYDGYVLSAPLKIANDDYIGVVVIKVTKDKNKYYLHEVILKKET